MENEELYLKLEAHLRMMLVEWQMQWVGKDHGTRATFLLGECFALLDTLSEQDFINYMENNEQHT